MNDFPQTSHLYGLKPVWIFRCSATEETESEHTAAVCSGLANEYLLTSVYLSGERAW